MLFGGRRTARIARSLRAPRAQCEDPAVNGSHWQIVYPLPEKHLLVSIIIPDPQRRGAAAHLCSIHFRSDQLCPYEILIVNNRSDDPEALALLAELAGRRMSMCSL